MAALRLTMPRVAEPSCLHRSFGRDKTSLRSSVMPATALCARQHIPPAGIQIVTTLVRVDPPERPRFRHACTGSMREEEPPSGVPSCLQRLYARGITFLRQASRLLPPRFVLILPNAPGSVMPAPVLWARQHLTPAGIQIPTTLVRVDPPGHHTTTHWSMAAVGENPKG